jgi:hypothetical protein
MSLLTKTATVTIAINTALSGAICLGSGVLCAIKMPAGWDAAALTFQVSDDQGVTWDELRDSSGTAITVASPTAGQRLELDASDFKSAVFLKVRSGTSGSAVNQTGAARVLTLVSRKFYPVS